MWDAMRKEQSSSNGSRKESARQDDSEVTLKTRFSHLTFAQFMLPMSTGGLALLLYSTPHQFRGLQTIGKIVFIFDLLCILTLCAGITYRFCARRGSLRLALTHPTESLFFPTILLAFVNVLNSSNVYGVPACGPWLVTAMRVLFWIYAAVALLAVILQYWTLFTAGERLTVQSMTPAWLLPALSTMLTGTLAGLTSANQPLSYRTSILVAGLTYQGFGWSVALMMYPIFIARLMQYGLPTPNLRPGMFVAVGPPGFTALAIIQMSNYIPLDYGYFAAHPQAANTLQVLALATAIFIWTVAFWFFCIAAISVVAGLKKMKFSLVWWAMIYPNVGFTLATSEIGKSLDSSAIKWVASAMTILLVCTYIIVIVNQVLAISRKQIMMPGKDEDKDEYTEDDEMHGIHAVPSARGR